MALGVRHPPTVGPDQRTQDPGRQEGTLPAAAGQQAFGRADRAAKEAVMPKDLDSLGCEIVVLVITGVVVIIMGGKPSKGTKKDKRLKGNKKNS